MKYSLLQIIKKIKKNGFAYYYPTLFQLLRNFLRPKWQRLFIFESPLGGIIPNEYSNDIKVELLRGVDDKLLSFANRRGAWYLTQTKDLFLKGNICFSAVIDGKMASCLWTSFNEVYLPDIEYTIKTPPEVVSLIDGYTLEEYRGKGLYKILWNDCLNYLVKIKKYTKIYGFINNKNKRSLNVHDKLNLNKIIYDITLLKLFGIRIHIKNKIS